MKRITICFLALFASINMINAQALTVADAITAGMALDSAATSEATYTIEGYVVNAQPFSLSYGNQIWYMADDAANANNQEFQAYGCVVISNNDTMQVLNGDKVQLTGKLFKYWNMSASKYVIEVKNGTAAFVTMADGDHTIDKGVEQLTVAQALAIGNDLAIGVTSTKTYEITGYVTALAGKDTDFEQYGNQTYWIADAQGTAASNAEGAFEVYRGVADQAVAVGYKVKVKTAIKKYNDGSATGLIESETKAAVTILEGGGTPVEKADVVFTSADFNGQGTSGTGSEVMATKDGVTFTCDKAFGDQYGVRCYKEGLVTISSTEQQIGKIVFNFSTVSGKYYNGNLDDEIIVNGMSWSTALTANARMSKISIYFGEIEAPPTITTDVVPENSGRVIPLNDTLFAIPNYGYHFVQWNDSVIENPRYIVLTQDTSFIAEFAVDKSGTCGDNLALRWEYDNNSKSLTIRGNGTLNSNYTFGAEAPTAVEKLVIAEGVTSIGDSAFLGYTSLTSVTIGNSVTSIGSRAFSGCSGLTFVTIPNSVTSIGDDAFYYCSGLRSVTIGNSVTSIGSSAFYNCRGLTSVTIPNSVTSIELGAFAGCSGLTAVTIGNSVTSIGDYAFSGCSGLTSVTIGNSVTSIGSSAFSGCSGLTFVTIPNSVTSIELGAFAGCSGLTAVTIGNSVTSIGDYAFSGCSGLTSVTIPNSVTSIGNRAFSKCSGLITTILEAEIPPALGEYSPFENCTSLSKIIVPCNTLAAYKYQWSTYSNILQYKPLDIRTTEGGFVTSELLCDPIEAIPYYGYHFVQWSDGNTENPRLFVVTPDTTIIAEFAIDKSGTCGENLSLNWAFEDSTKTLTISGSGALTENYTFGLEAPTQMEHLVIGNEVTAIGDSAFYGRTTIAQVTIGGNVTAIGSYAFADIDNRQLTSIVMPAELTTIGDYAFSGNTYLESIDFNAKLLSIGAYAFKDCRRVSEMTCMAETTPDVGTNALSSINSYASLCVPASCVRKYQVDPNWGRFDLCELGATTSTGSVTTVIVEPSDNTALFTWPTENEAATYTLQITKDGEVFCTLVFNTNGQLTGIAFAPSRTGTPHAPAATLANGAMQFTVTGLNVANKYAYRLAVTDASNVELQSYSGEFATTGYEGEVNPGGEPESGHEAVDQLHQDPASNTHKFLHNGQILIQRGDRTYTVSGQEIK